MYIYIENQNTELILEVLNSWYYYPSI